ncbi:MAG: tRNA lysidine(34) synthetase TilS [Chloroflexi bacterium]|nr:tRNA lysidine(34) synthetase TilS [Chloroflexota bacterium]
MKRQQYQEPLLPRVLGYIRQHHLVSDQHLLVAVSGGPDSVCLLHILTTLQDELDIKLHVAHLDHQLRGAESAADARYVARLAEQLGIPSTIDRRDVKAYQARRHLSLEEAAREVRYTFLAEVARSIGTSRVAVGHTTDDNIETILMHLIRGSGTRGLRGLQPNTRWPSADSSLTIIRPLLTVSRQETSAYCYDHQLAPRTDTSNQSLSPLRNRIRHQLLPLLQSYNQRVSDALLRTARIAGDDLAFLDKETARLWNKVARRQGDIIILDKARLLKLPSALQRHLLRKAIEELLGNLRDIETSHIEEIIAALPKPSGKSLNLPGGLTFSILYDRYQLGMDSTALCPFPVLKTKFALKIPGETLLPGWRVTAAVIKRRRITRNGVEGTGPTDNFTVYLDLDKAGDKAVVRRRHPGDRFQPMGMNQLKKMGEFMVDAKIPRAWRQRVPIICSPEQILWVVGWRIDDRVKVTENTRHVLRLEFERTPDTC